MAFTWLGRHDTTEKGRCNGKDCLVSVTALSHLHLHIRIITTLIQNKSFTTHSVPAVLTSPPPTLPLLHHLTALRRPQTAETFALTMVLLGATPAVWQPNNIASQHTSTDLQLVTDGSKPIDPLLAVCYQLPYGGWGLSCHLILLYSTIQLIRDRRPLAPSTQPTFPTTSMFLCSASYVLFMAAGIISLIPTACHDSIV